MRKCKFCDVHPVGFAFFAEVVGVAEDATIFEGMEFFECEGAEFNKSPAHVDIGSAHSGYNFT